MKAAHRGIAIIHPAPALMGDSDLLSGKGEDGDLAWLALGHAQLGVAEVQLALRERVAGSLYGIGEAIHDLDL